MVWQPRFSDGLYHHLAPGLVDSPAIEQIDRAFEDLDRVPDVSAVEFFSGTTVTLDNAAHVKKRLQERGLRCAIVHHGEPYARKALREAAFTSGDPKTRRQAITMCLDSLEVARSLEAPGIYVFVPMDGSDYPFQQDFRAARQYTMDALHEICEAAGDLRVALEYRPYMPRGRTIVGTSSRALEMIAEMNRPNLGIQLECSHTLMGLENLAQAAWEAARRGLLYHVHLNDTQLPQDLSMIFGSVHFWESLEFLHWLREADYPHYLGVDVVWMRESAVESATQYIRNVQFMLRVLDAIDLPALQEAMGRGEILATQDLVWTALRDTS